MPIRDFKPFEFPERNPGRRDIGRLHAALKKLRIKVSEDEVRRGEIGDATKDAIKDFQKRNRLRVDGVIGPKTIAALQSEMAHSFFARSKPRTTKLHEMLGRLGYKLDNDEAKGRLFGKTTEKALKDFQKKQRLTADGRMNQGVFKRLEKEALEARFQTKTQVAALHRKLVRAIRIAKLEIQVDPQEVKKREIGATTKDAIRAFQKKYQLDETGKLDPETYERLESVSASRPSAVKMLKVRSAQTLIPVLKPLRLNMTNKHVGELQKTLAFLGYKVAQKEFDTSTFGKTTRTAVLEFQRAQRLPVNGHVEGATLKALSLVVMEANPAAAAAQKVYRVRGSVRDDLWKGKVGLKVQVWEKTLRGSGTLLAERKTLPDGFYDVPYDPPRNPVNGQVKAPFHLRIRFIDAGGQELDAKVLFNPTPIAWINFTEGADPYRGTSQYDAHMRAIVPVLDDVALKDVEETPVRQEITHLAVNSGLAVDDVMRLALAHRAAENLGDAAIGEEVFFAFVSQNLPPSLPSDLLGSTVDWTLIAALVERTVRDIVFMEEELQTAAFDNAAAENLIPIATVRKRKQILAALTAKRQSFALEKPILVGNGSLKQLLDASMVPAASHNKVASALLAHGSLCKDFWADVKDRAGDFGGDAAVADLETTARLGEITKHHDPTMVFLKNALGDPAHSTLNATPDFAKLDQVQWRALIDANGGQVPDGIEGNTPDERKDAFAASLAGQSERLFPGIALAAKVDPEGQHQHGLTKLAQVRTLLDIHDDLDLRETNLDKFFKDVVVDPDVLSEIKVLQRVHRLAPSTEVGRALIEKKLHHSAAIVFRGKKRFSGMMAEKGIDQRTALTTFGYAQFQYAQVLRLLAEYRFELHQTNPKAIVQHTYSEKEQQDILGNIPNLETLFGAMDFCECKHCQSWFGPAAYLADVLRFLDAQPADKPPYNTVLEVLIGGQPGIEARRPDIAKIKLNCENTDTPLPYIDLVCEILEGAVPAPNPASDFSFQTTWKREELRAFSEHVRIGVYNKLRKAPFPMDASFDLWQEETRVWLKHLGVPRHELMKTLQARPTGGGARAPLDMSIAGEYFGISTHETSIITQPAPAAGTQQGYWGFDPTRAKIDVREFLNHTKLDDDKLEYRRLLELMQVKWIAPVKLQRDPPASSCDLSLQSMVNLNLDLMDRIHRFIRLWRPTGYEMWQLDLLVRAPHIGNGVIDPAAVVRLYEFRRVQQTFNLPFETAFALFHHLNTEQRTEPDDATKTIDSQYVRLFQNRAVSDPVDPMLAVNQLDGTQDLDTHKAALIAALGVTDADLTRLIDRTDNKRTLENLTLIHNYLIVSRILNITFEKLLQLQDLAGITDIFASPKAMLDFIELYERVKASRLQIDELDYLLSFRLNINTASLEQLIPLPGIGPVKAQAIIDHREANGPFQRISALKDVPGIASAVVDGLTGLITISPESPYGLREEAIVRIVEGLRESLRTASADATDREGQIADKVASSFALPPERAKLLLTKVSLDTTLISTIDEPRLTERDPADATKFRFEINSANFKNIFEAISLLHKTKILLERHSISSTEDLEWIIDQHAAFGLLGPGELPVRVQPHATLIPKWVALSKWLELRHWFPEPEEASLRGIFDLAADVDGAGVPQTPIADLRSAIHTLTQWPLKDLEALHGILKLKYDAAANDYTKVETYMRLAKAMRAVKRIGVGADVAGTWALRDVDAGNVQAVTAQQAREAAKSKYDYPVWLDRAGPLYDAIRERKRTSLIRYLVELSLRTEPASIQVGGKDWRNPKYWEDANDLLRYFLIDVEMTSCQLTSRIKQAISSVQMFVQRCFLNLEQPYVQVSQDEREDTVSLNSWRQWRYLKSYRIAEAAKKVFLYPENWIEPELRDDKSPFFKDLEDELLQGELTHDRAEASFRHYLEKLHEVSRLEIVGVYHEIDDDNSHDDLPPNIDLVHVVGRTKSDPAVYYYRSFDLNDGSWSAWEKIEVDITGDHLIPVVYNRKLHLFWLVFTEKPQKNKKQPPAKASAGPTNSAEPPKLLEIQLAWCEQKEGGWTSKSLSREKLIHPWERPLYSYHLKPRYKSRENILWLDLYISTSREFNETRFYDPFKHERHYLSATQKFDESGRPWHSSSFLFDGTVVGLKMKPLAGSYHLIDSSGDISDCASPTTSHEYVRRNFGDAGRRIDRLQGPYEIAPRLRLPDGMRYRYNRLTNNKVLASPTRLNILEYGAPRTLARGANAPFEIAFSQGQIQFDTAAWGLEPILYQDPRRSFFIRPEIETHILGYNTVVQRRKYCFLPFYHPYSALFLRELNRSGLDGLLQRHLQRFPHTYYPGNNFQFSTDYIPVTPSEPDSTAERDQVDFERYGAYSIYNWEVFFHAPLMIACKLSQNQRFEEAMRWFHYVFDPTCVEALDTPQRFWTTKPFYDQNSEDYRKQRIENLLRNIGVNLDELRAWRNDPFNPHRIARHRPVAYQKTVVMKYIDNLIAWGDQLFRRDSMESINEATTLYVLAHEILGPRPVRVPRASRQDRSYEELTSDGDLDPLGNKSVPALLENLTPPPKHPTRVKLRAEPLPLLDILYFCIPPNDVLLEYWDRVEDRLFKIRHCMNIEGVVRQLPLFEPPIDPALLVKAAAAGVDIGSVLSLSDVEPGQYRFRLLSSKAVEFCAEVRALGDKLLSVLEKRDAEELALLRAGHGTKLLEATQQVRKKQIDEAKETVAGLEQAKLQAEERRDYYRGREFINAWEGTALALSGVSALAETAIATGYILAGGLKFIPTFVVGGAGFGGSPTVHTHVIDGMKVGDAAEAAVKTMRAIATMLDKYAGLANTMGSYTRRQDEWDHQGKLAEIDFAQIDRQIAAAQLRQAIAERELENLELQIEQFKTTEEYYKSKYTNQQLYEWMLQQITTVYFQTYKLAFDMALRAEKCLQFELGQEDLSFVEFGYWDSLKKGLLAGEKLGYDIRRMDSAYIDQYKRELELTKYISIADVMPLKLLELKTTGACDIDFPEWIFDMDYPGHFRRRIKSVSLTIPCVTGPYIGVHATLSLVAHGVRVNEDVAAGFGDPLAPDGPRFVSGRVPTTSIATSHAQNDAGLFEINFNDERYLPFEGAGAVSRWRLSLPKETNQFDFGSISDIVVHIRYTATAGNVPLTNAARANVAAVLPTAGLALLDIKRGFGSEWQRFFNPDAGKDEVLSFTLTIDHFPFYARNKTVNLTAFDLFLESSHDTAFDIAVTPPGTAPAGTELAAADPAFDGIHHLVKAGMPPKDAVGIWRVQIKKDTATTFHELVSDDIRNAYLVLQYTTA